MFWRSVRNTEGKIQTQNTCICAKTNIKELYIQVFWLWYPVCVDKFHFQPPLPTLSWSPYVCVCLYYPQSRACVWRKVNHLVTTFDFHTSAHQHYRTQYRHAFQPSCTRLKHSPPETPLQLTRMALSLVLLLLEDSANLRNASSPGKTAQSRRLVDCLYVTRRALPERDHLQLLGPLLVPALWRYTICSSWKNLLI